MSVTPVDSISAGPPIPMTESFSAPRSNIQCPVPESTPVAQKPYLTITANSAPLGLDLPELWRFRDLVYQLALRDLKLRYKQTFLGVIWVVLQPLMAAGIFTFVFGVLAKLPTDGKPQFLVSFAGLLGWNLFAGSLTRISGCLTGNSHLISKVYFPRLVLPISAVPSVLVDFAVALGMCTVLLVVYAILPGWQVLLLPLWIATLVMLAMGIGLVTASLSVSYRDIQYILPVGLQMMLYASPVGYDTSAVPEHLRSWYYLNPLAGVIQAFRWSLLGGNAPSPLGLSITVASSAVFAVFGLWSFRRMERRFADVV